MWAILVSAVDIQSRGELVLTDGAITANSVQRGRGGDIRITADNIQLGPDDREQHHCSRISGAPSVLVVFGPGRGGNLEISANSLTVKNGSP